MAVDICSRMAYEGVDVNKAQLEILKFVWEGNRMIWHDKLLSLYMNKPINKICNRIGELLKMGVLENMGRVKIEGHYCRIWRLTKN